jgi:hypothetical protein
VALHQPSPASLFIYSSRGKCPFPTFQWSFPHTATATSFPASRLLGGAATPAFSGQLIYLQFREGLPLPHLQSLGCPALFATCLFFFVFVYYSVCFFFLFFPWVGGQSVQGAMVIWPRAVCGSTACHLAHLVVCISQAGRSWHLVALEPSWFLRLTWSGDGVRRLGVWRCWSFASSQWFFCKVFLQHLSKILL